MKRLISLATTSCILAFQVVVSSAMPPVIIESKCSPGTDYVEYGSGWQNSSSKSNKTTCGNGSRSTVDPGAYADFIPTVPMEGTYDVFITWGEMTSQNKGPNAENATVQIIDDNGQQDFVLSLRGHSNCSSNANQMIYVGRGYFIPGQGHCVRLVQTADGQCFNGANKRFITADAVQLEFLAPVAIESRTWSSIKALRLR